MQGKIKIVADNKIPFLRDALEPFVVVRYLPGNEITKNTIEDADALIIRTRTKCDKMLLENSGVKLIATATIGIDHIDTGYCDENNIVWKNAPGCNASSVMQYVASALLNLCKVNNIELKGKTMGIVGVGNVGSLIEKFASCLGLNILLNDPPRQRIEGDAGFVNYEELISNSDIVTFHVPLIMNGIDKTYHMCDTDFFNKCKNNLILINTSRGSVINTSALKEALTKKKISHSVIDVWENEPEIDLELLKLIDIATPHIAGYSADGKANGTAVCVNAVSEFFNLGITDWRPANIPLPSNETNLTIDCGNKSEQDILFEAINSTYQIMSDDARLRNSVTDFENQRGDYPTRREFLSYSVKLKNGEEKIKHILTDLGFKLTDKKF